ncbi:MAG: alpha/beta hydrolase-fold protein [Acidobacteriota bacterium]
MRKEVHWWYSPNLGYDMPIAVYGHYGRPVLMFPTAAADFEEYERFLLIDAIAPHIESGKIKVFSINSINRESWMNDQIHPGEAAYRHAQYDRYVSQEVVPFIYHHCNTSGIGIATTGASFGAFHAANTLFKHPDQFQVLIAMSGFYDLQNYFKGYYDDNCYFNNPAQYVPRLEDPYYLDRLRYSCNIVIITGQGAWEKPEASYRFSELLHQKGIPHVLDMWGYDVAHDWPWWRNMLNVYIPKLF